MLTISDLPEEVIMSVFSYLPFRDKQSARLVCRSWLYLLDSSSFTRSEVFVVKKSRNLNECRLLRRHVNFRIEGIQYPLEHQPFWERHGPNVRSIEIFGVTLQSGELYDIISFCPNIQFLSLRQFSWWRASNKDSEISTMAGVDVDKSCRNLQNLLGLNMEITSRVNGSDFHLFIKYARRLESLKSLCVLEMNKLAVEAIVSKPLKKLMLTPHEVPRFAAHSDFVHHLGPQLTSLVLNYIPGSLDAWLPILADKCPFLEKLAIIFRLRALNDPSVLLLFKNLKFLSFEKSQVGDNILSGILRLEQIRGLDLSECSNLTSEGILAAFGSKLHPELVHLRLSSVNDVTDSVLEGILPLLPNLKKLYLEDCHEVTNEGFVSIINHCKGLEYLSLRDCNRIKHWVAPVSYNSLTKLKYLSLSFSCRHRSLSNKLKLPELRTLWWCFEDELSIDGLEGLLTDCPSLRTVYCAFSLCEGDQHRFQDLSRQRIQPFRCKTLLDRPPKFNFF